MNFAARLALASTMSLAIGCAAPAEEDASVGAEQNVSAAPASEAGARVIEANISYLVREELSAALGDAPDSDMGFMTVGIPGVLQIQHQYSIAALRLEVPSWFLRTDASVDHAEWGMDSSLGLSFPRGSAFVSTDEEFKASHAAAKKMFNALKAAPETVTQEQNATVTTRASAKRSFVCTATARAGHDTTFLCTIGGVANVGGTGLFWSNVGAR